MCSLEEEDFRQALRTPFNKEKNLKNEISGKRRARQHSRRRRNTLVEKKRKILNTMISITRKAKKSRSRKTSADRKERAKEDFRKTKESF